MIEIICFLLPPLLTISIRQHLQSPKVLSFNKTITSKVLEYGIITLINTFITSFIVCYIFKHTSSLVSNLENYNDFFVHYLCVAIFVSLVVPLIENYFRKNWKVNFRIVKGLEEKNYDKIKHIILFVTVFLIIFITILRCMDNNFWGDEAFSIKLAKQSISGLIIATANDVHPPLYYLVLKFICAMLGFNGFSYHLASVIPFLMLIILASTLFYKDFGFKVSYIFIVLMGIAPCAVIYNLEVRMYSWAMFFVTLCFYEGYKIISSESRKHWILFTIAGIGAAYSHYFAFAAIILIYLCNFIILIYRSKRNIWKCLSCTAISILGYAPWLFIFIKQASKTKEGFWNTYIPQLSSCLEFIFGSGLYGHAMILIFILGGLIFALKRFGIVKIFEDSRESEENDPKQLMIQINGPAEDSLKNEFGLICIGFLVPLMIIIFGLTYAYTIKPIFLERYLYPIVGIVWLSMGICISKINKKPLIYLCIIVFIFVNCIPIYINTYKSELIANKSTNQTIAYMKGNLDEHSIIASNGVHLNWTVLECYFPATTRKSLDSINWATISSNQKVFLFDTNKIDENLISDLKKEKLIYTFELHSSLGSNDFYLYKISKSATDLKK